MKKYKPYLKRVDLVKNQVERERIQEQEAKRKRKQRIQEQNRRNHLRYQEQLRSEMAARYFHSVISVGGESFSNTRSLLFDGTDSAIVGSNSLGITSGISISVWVKTTDASSGFKQIIGEYNWASPASNANWLLYLSNVGNRIAFLNYNDAGQRPINTVVSAAAANIDDGQWHHILVTWDNTTNTNSFKIFFDGNIVLQVTPSLTGIRSVSSTPVYIASGLGSSVYLESNMDEIAVWDSDQSSNASIIYNEGVPADLTSLNPLSWWRFEEGSGTTATDSGTGGNDGTINGATYSTDVPS